jgi:hypothetical protein
LAGDSEEVSRAAEVVGARKHFVLVGEEVIGIAFTEGPAVAVGRVGTKCKQALEERESFQNWNLNLEYMN